MNFASIEKGAFDNLSMQLPKRIRANARSIIVYLLHITRRNEGYVESYHLNRGDALFAVTDLTEITGVSRQGCRTVLNHLKKIKFLSLKLTNPKCLISIENFDSYVIPPEESNQ